MQIPPQTDAVLQSNDLIGLDTVFTGAGTPNNTGGAILNFSVRNSGTGAETVLASSIVGSGVTYGLSQAGSYIAVSPAGIIYYTNNAKNIVALNPVTLVRSVVSDGTNASLGPLPVNISCLTWDFGTGTVFYYDFGNGATRPYPGSGFYRMDPATGIRTAVSLNAGSPGSGVTINFASYMVTDPFGNLFYLDQGTVGGNDTVVGELPVTVAGGTTYGARKVVSSNSVGTQADGTFYALFGLALDPNQAVTLSGGLPVAESLIATDSGSNQTTSALFRIPSDTGNHSRLITFNSTNANNGSAVFDLPVSGVADTTGRIYYVEDHNNTNGILTVIPAGTHAAASLSGATNLGLNALHLVPVPPPAPTLAAGTTSNVLGMTATLNGNVTADGGVANSGIIARGFVYAPTATTGTPKIGVAGVTQVSNFVASSLPVAQGLSTGAFSNNLTGLTQGASYTFSAYAQNVSGFTYSTPVTFATANVPTVTSPTVANVTGVSATLGGNVTSNGGATLTARGVVYSVTTVNPTPTIGGSGVMTVTDASATTGVFTDGAGNVLVNGTAYSYRAYATNAVGTSYSGTGTFTTAAPPTANSQSVNVPFNTATAITLTGSDPNTPAQTLTYTVTVAPTHGTLSGTAPNLTYTSTGNYQGADSFKFTTTNAANLTSAAATVSITVAAGTPTANAQSVNVN